MPEVIVFVKYDRIESWHDVLYAMPSVSYLYSTAQVRGSVFRFCKPSGIVQLSRFGVLWFY